MNADPAAPARRRCLQINPEHASRCEKSLDHSGHHSAWGTSWSRSVSVELLMLLAILGAPFVIIAAMLIAH